MWGKKHKKLAIALTCADWRLHQHKVDLNARLAKILGVEGLDLICVPGPDGLKLPVRDREWQTAIGQIRLLIGAHAPLAIVVLAHQRCAGHPVADADHNVDVVTVAWAIRAETGFPGRVLAAVADYKSDKKWVLRAQAEV
jgi:hypothetical protein